MVPRKKPIRILYVDDEPSLLDVTRMYLESKGGFIVDTCDRPEKALEHIICSQYDAIVSDYQMPVLDGIGLLKGVRGNDIDTPFIIFTGRGREEVAIEALNNGADFYIQKGGDVKTQFAELMNSIRTCVSGHRARSNLRLSETSLRTMADNMNDPVVTLDKDGRILYVNPQFLKSLGGTIDRYRGKPLREISVDETADPDDTPSSDLVLRRVDGSFAWMEVSEAEIMYQGEICDMLILHDVTEKRRAEKSIVDAHRKMTSMFDSMVDPIYVSDMDDHSILYANKELMRMVDHDIIGKKCYEVLQGKDAPCDFCTNPIIRDESRRPYVWEHHNAHLDHHYRIVDNVIKWPDGRDVRFEITFDITDMKKAELRAEDTNQRLKAILKTVPDTLFIIDRDGIITEFKPSSDDSSRIDRNNVLGRGIDSFLEGGQVSTVLEARDRAFMSGSVETCEYGRDTKEGYREYSARLAKLNDDEVLVVVSDVTAAKYDMKLMEESERLHRSLFDNSPVAVMVQELEDLELVYANPKALGNLGFNDISELRDEGIPWASPPYSREDAIRVSAELPQKKRMELDWLSARRDGSTFWERINLVLLEYQGRKRMMNLSYDITAFKESFEELYRSQSRYKALISASNTGAWEYDRHSDSLWTSDEYFTMLGHDPADFSQDATSFNRWLALMHPEDREEAERVFRDYYNNPGEEMYENFFRLRRKDEGWSWIWSRGKALTDSDGEYTGTIVGTHIDISPMKELEKSLKESRHRYKILANSGKALIYTTAPEGAFIFVNDVVTDFTGGSSSEHLNDRWVDWIHPEDRQDVIEERDRGIASRKPYTIRYRLKRRDGSYRWMLDEGVPLHDANGNYIGYMGHCMDVDDIIELEKALSLMNEKLKLMTSVTRHDILNQLVILSGFIELSRDSECNEDVVHNLSMMEKAVKAIHRHIEFTRDYEALGANPPEWQSFNELILLQGSFGVRLFNNVTGLEILGDPLLDRAFHNLIDNSVKHGVEVDKVVIDQRIAEDGSLILSLEDDGVGVPPEEKARIFNKGYGRNHGQGLFLVREILSITGMSIVEVGRYGEGARFEITVPPESYRFTDQS